jgi:hypothetical protein
LKLLDFKNCKMELELILLNPVFLQSLDLCAGTAEIAETKRTETNRETASARGEERDGPGWSPTVRDCWFFWAFFLGWVGGSVGMRLV